MVVVAYESGHLRELSITECELLLYFFLFPTGYRQLVGQLLADMWLLVSRLLADRFSCSCSLLLLQLSLHRQSITCKLLRIFTKCKAVQALML